MKDIADRLGCRLDGDGDIEIVRVASIEDATSGDLTFVANSKYHGWLGRTHASAVIVGPSEPIDDRPPFAVLRADQPYVAFAHALRLFVGPYPPAKGVDRLSAISADVQLGPDVSIGPFVVVGRGAAIGARTVIYPNVVVGPGAHIGDDCVLHAGVSIRDGVQIANRVTILDGAVIGSDGFGFARDVDGTHVKIPQHAAVVIEDDVEIGANTTVDRPAVGETRIRAGTKIDNLVQVAHGVKIGRRSLLAAQVGIAGSTIIEDEVVIGGQVGINGHIRIGTRASATGKSGITRNVAAGEVVSGYPAVPNAEWRKVQVLLRQLPELKKHVQDLEARIAHLQEKLAECQK